MKSATKISISELLTSTFQQLLQSKGVDFVNRLGEENIRQVVADVLCGQNLRASTEILTRQRLAKLNAATLMLYFRGVEIASDFSRQIPRLATQRIKARAPQIEKSLCHWILGLTTKGFQNVLRSDINLLEDYADSFADALKRLATQAEQDYGNLQCVLTLPGKSIKLDWHDFLSLFCTIGSQTLAIRGSEKSTYGKLFERLILGSVLTVLGFEHSHSQPKKLSGVFWLSSRFGEREAVVDVGKAIRFDLGFIGVGNPEITKDKVSRFERTMEINKTHYHSATYIIVDRVGETSSLEQHAERAGAKVIQMSMSHWPKQLAKLLLDQFGYRSQLLQQSETGLGDFFLRKLKNVDFRQFVQGLKVPENLED